MSRTHTTISVRVQPNAGRNRIAAFKERVLYIRLAAPPVEGKANEALIKYLSVVLRLPKSAISIERGLTGRNKTVALAGIESDRLLTMINEAVEAER